MAHLNVIKTTYDFSVRSTL